MREKTRFRYIDHFTDVEYIGEVEIERDHYGICAVTILECWKYDLFFEEVFPYEKNFPATFRQRLEGIAIEQSSCPPSVPVVFPSEWNDIEVLSVETQYTINARLAALPVVNSDKEARVLGLKTVRKIIPIKGQQYRIIATGSIDDVRRELHRVRVF